MIHISIRKILLEKTLPAQPDYIIHPNGDSYEIKHHSNIFFSYEGEYAYANLTRSSHIQN